MAQIGVVIDPLELNENWLRRIQAGGINLLGLHPNPKDSTLQQMLQWLALPDVKRYFERLQSMGVEIEWEIHAASWLLPRERFRTNPGWFRMNAEGERVADHNFCCSNAEALQAVADGAQRLSALLPSTTHRYHFWLDDVESSACCCDSCRSLSPADQALTVYNAILRGIRRNDPQALHCYLAYHDTNDLPRQVKPAEGIFLEYAPFDREHHKAICDPSSSKNRRQLEKLPRLLDYFGAAHAQVLDYWLDNSLFSNWTKPPREFHLRENVLEEDGQYYRRLGFSCLSCFACYLGEAYTDLYPEPEDPVRYGKILSNL